MSNGHLPLVCSVPAMYFPSGFCVRCLHILHKRTNIVKQCDGKVLLHFFFLHVLFTYVSKINKHATEATGQIELGKIGIIVTESLLKPC